MRREADDLPRVVRVRLARDRIDREYASPLDLHVLAAEAGYSLFHFVRAFRQTYGETPGRYLTSRRLERAQELLRTTDLTVTEVCHHVGFASLGTFSARFKQRTGQSPLAYREAAVRRYGRPPVPGCFARIWARPASS